MAEPALARVLPLYAGLAIAAAVLFGPTGMSASDLAQAVKESQVVRLSLWSGWLLATAAAARALFRGEPAIYLRSLPIPLAVHLAVPALLGLAMQAPWAWVFVRGDGLSAGLGAGLVAAASAALIALRPRNPVEIFGRIAALLALGFALWTGQRLELMGAAALPIYLLAVPGAWTRAGERAGGAGFLRVAGPAPVALGLSALAWMWRGGRSILGRALLWTAAGGGAVGFAARANEVDGSGFAALLIAVSGVALAAAMGGVAVCMVEHERASRWLLDSTGAGGGLRVTAAALPTLIIGVVCGAGLGVLAATVAAVSGADLFRALGHGILAGAGWSLLALAVARRCERRRGVDGTLVVVVLLLSSIALAIAAATLGEAAILALAAFAGGVSLVGADRVERGA